MTCGGFDGFFVEMTKLVWTWRNNGYLRGLSSSGEIDGTYKKYGKSLI